MRKGETNLDTNIEESLKNNKMELVDPFDNTMKNSLFFRINISGRIESANVKIKIKKIFSFTKVMLFFVNMI